MYTLEFTKFEPNNLTVQPPKTGEKSKGKFASLQYSTSSGPVYKYATPRDLRQLWSIKPAGEDADKFVLEVSLGPNCADFVKKVNTFDKCILDAAFANKLEWFGAKHASRMETKEGLTLTQTKMLIDGRPNRTGGKYDDSIKFKIEGWQKYLKEKIYKDNDTSGMVKECIWDPRLVNSLDSASDFKDRETKFYLFNSRDPVTGVDNYSNKVPVIDAAGHQLKDKDGNALWRYVGPQDCVPNSLLTIEFAIRNVWIIDSRFGSYGTAVAVFIKAPPPKVSQVLEGVKILTSVDPVQAAKAVMNLQSANQDTLEEEEDSEGVPSLQRTNTYEGATTLSSNTGIDMAVDEGKAQSPTKKKTRTTKPVTLSDDM